MVKIPVSDMAAAEENASENNDIENDTVSLASSRR